MTFIVAYLKAQWERERRHVTELRWEGLLGEREHEKRKARGWGLISGARRSGREEMVKGRERGKQTSKKAEMVKGREREKRQAKKRREKQKETGGGQAHLLKGDVENVHRGALSGCS